MTSLVLAPKPSAVYCTHHLAWPVIHLHMASSGCAGGVGGNIGNMLAAMPLGFHDQIQLVNLEHCLLHGQDTHWICA